MEDYFKAIYESTIAVLVVLGVALLTCGVAIGGLVVWLAQ